MVEEEEEGYEMVSGCIGLGRLFLLPGSWLVSEGSVCEVLISSSS